jgi:choline dehydrogenase
MTRGVDTSVSCQTRLFGVRSALTNHQVREVILPGEKRGRFVGNYDYLVVGGGTAGCVLAARLSANPNLRVLLLEAGPSEGPAAAADPSAWFALLGSYVDWADKTTPQPGTNGDVHAWPRGKVLGGSSGINGMIHLRGHQSSYDRWETLGARGWNYRSLLPFMQRSERTEGGDAQVRGVEGPMLIGSQPEPNALSQAWFDAAVEAGHPVTDDRRAAVGHGVSWTEMNIANGRRQSAADAYLRPLLARPNLTVVTNARVNGLLFDGAHCCGAEYTLRGIEQSVEIEREVLVCAGAIGSPQLLMLSGIGPAAHLRALGIDVLVDLPGVGQNLHDHPMCWVSYAAADALPPPNGIPHVLLRSTHAVEVDLQLGFAAAAFGPRWTVRPESGYSVTFSLMSPSSRGSVRLSGSDIVDPLIINPAYFADAHDLERMVDGLSRAREIGEAAALSRWRRVELEPGPDVIGDDACRAYIRHSAGTYFHPVGTCRIGTDELAVVDPLLRVRGVLGLRIADASVMPTIVSANTNSTVLAIAEKAASFLQLPLTPNLRPINQIL